MRIITFNCPGENGFDIDQFGGFDIFFIQRCPASMLIPYPHYYTENYPHAGLCIVSKDYPLDVNVAVGQFSWYADVSSYSQGKHWQTFSITVPTSVGDMPCKFINALPSYPTDEQGTIITDKERILQTKELLDLMDINSVLVGDFHSKDEFLEDEIKLEKRNLINHIKENTFTAPHGDDSIDKIITTKESPILISNVSVIKYERHFDMGHWPIKFDLIM